MPHPEEFSPVSLYGDREIFERRQKEGYDELAFGRGEWVGDYRIVGIFVFYSQDGRIATYEHPKAMDQSMQTYRGTPFEAQYSPEEFERHKQESKITLSKRLNLADLLKKWQE